MITAIEAAKIAQEELAKLTKREFVGITGLSRDDENWIVNLEVVEKKSIPDAQDLLGGYALTINEERHVVGFERKTLRKRGEMNIKEV